MRTISYDPLWKKLVDAKMNKTELAEKAGFSRGTMTKMGKNEPVGLEVIQKICNVLDCEIYDVVAIISNSDSRGDALCIIGGRKLK